MKAAVTRVNSIFSVSKIACCVFSCYPGLCCVGRSDACSWYIQCLLFDPPKDGGWFACLAIVLGCPLPIGATPSVDGSCLTVRAPSHFSLVFDLG